jgi:hypothetical protein
MIFENLKFEKACCSTSAKLAALPQHNEKWCLAMKTGIQIVYLGNSNTDQRVEFSTLDELINYARQNEIGEVLVITGAKEWCF